MRVAEGKVHIVGWTIARLIEKQAAGSRPSWSAVESSLDEGKRMKMTAEAAERATKTLGESYRYERNGPRARATWRS